MFRVGPNSLADFQPGGTAFYVVHRDEPILLGPVEVLGPDYWVVRLFLIIGKLIHLRRLSMPEAESLPEGFEAQYRQWLSAMVDQAVSGSEDEYDHFIQLTQGVTPVITSLIRQIRSLALNIDQYVARLLEGDVVPDQLSLDPADPLPARVDQLIEFMTQNGIALEDNTGGFRDYLMEIFTTSDGLPAAFPISADQPKVLDEWITDQVLSVEDVLVTDEV